MFYIYIYIYISKTAIAPKRRLRLIIVTFQIKNQENNIFKKEQELLKTTGNTFLNIAYMK